MLAAELLFRERDSAQIESLGLGRPTGVLAETRQLRQALRQAQIPSACVLRGFDLCPELGFLRGQWNVGSHPQTGENPEHPATERQPLKWQLVFERI